MKNGFGKIAVIGLLLACLTSTVWAQTSFYFEESRESVLVRYSRTPGELRGPDTSTTLTVYGNGRTVVHFPPYGKRKGDYEMTLSKAELNELVATLINNGVMEYDAKSVAAEQQAIMRASNMGFYVGDADVSKIEIGLARYSPKGAVEMFDVKRQVAPSALQAEAKQYPSIESLVNLANAERQLIKLINNANLSPINSAE